MYLTMCLSKKIYFMVLSDQGWETERPIKKYDFKFYIKIYWFLSSVLYDLCIYSSSSKSVENEKYKRYISLYVYYLYCRCFFMVDLWNNYI